MTAFFTLMGRTPRFILRVFAVLGLSLFFLFGLRYSTVPLGDTWTAISILARDHQFNYVTWELNAIGVKLGQAMYGLHPYMNEADRSQYVREYMADIGHAGYLESQISVMYSDPAVENPDAASAELRSQRDKLRVDLEARQPLAESILEGQVASVLVDERFGFGGQLLPPLSMHFTQVPTLLVVSPRDKIRFDVAINLDSMTVDEQAALEAQIDAQHDVASLIVPLGGIALYPSMILESPSIPYAVDVIAHEWLHHYLFVFPLGYTYDFAGEARIINETTASLFGQEVGRLVLKRYYPDLLPPAPSEDAAARLVPDTVAPRFDFGAAMNETRITVDRLLLEGNVEAAEAYMEERRELFVANGYVIRKLNQAFFAFYGGYQSGSPGEGGSDPIGPAIQGIRNASLSIYEWIATLRGITTREQLLATRARMVREN